MLNQKTDYVKVCYLKKLPEVLILFDKPQAAQAHYLWVRASEVIWWEILELLVYYLMPNKCKKS